MLAALVISACGGQACGDVTPDPNQVPPEQSTQAPPQQP